MAVLFAYSNRSANSVDLADRFILRPGDLEGGGAWLVEKELGPPIFPMQNQSSYQFCLFYYHNVFVSEM